MKPISAVSTTTLASPAGKTVEAAKPTTTQSAGKKAGQIPQIVLQGMDKAAQAFRANQTSVLSGALNPVMDGRLQSMADRLAGMQQGFEPSSLGGLGAGLADRGVGSQVGASSSSSPSSGPGFDVDHFNDFGQFNDSGGGAGRTGSGGVEVTSDATDVQSSGGGEHVDSSINTRDTETGETYSEHSSYDTDGNGNTTETEHIETQGTDGSSSSYDRTETTNSNGDRDIHTEESHSNSDGTTVTVTEDSHYSDGPGASDSSSNTDTDTDSTSGSDTNDSAPAAANNAAGDQLDEFSGGGGSSYIPRGLANTLFGSRRSDPRSTDPAPDTNNDGPSGGVILRTPVGVSDPPDAVGLGTAGGFNARVIQGGLGRHPGAIDPNPDAEPRDGTGGPIRRPDVAGGGVPGRP